MEDSPRGICPILRMAVQCRPSLSHSNPMLPVGRPNILHGSHYVAKGNRRKVCHVVSVFAGLAIFVVRRVGDGNFEWIEGDGLQSFPHSKKC